MHPAVPEWMSKQQQQGKVESGCSLRTSDFSYMTPNQFEMIAYMTGGNA